MDTLSASHSPLAQALQSEGGKGKATEEGHRACSWHNAAVDAGRRSRGRAGLGDGAGRSDEGAAALAAGRAGGARASRGREREVARCAGDGDGNGGGRRDAGDGRRAASGRAADDVEGEGVLEGARV